MRPRRCVLRCVSWDRSGAATARCAAPVGTACTGILAASAVWQRACFRSRSPQFALLCRVRIDAPPALRSIARAKRSFHPTHNPVLLSARSANGGIGNDVDECGHQTFLNFAIPTLIWPRVACLDRGVIYGPNSGVCAGVGTRGILHLVHPAGGNRADRVANAHGGGSFFSRRARARTSRTCARARTSRSCA